MIIEDDPDVCASMRTFFEGSYDVVTAENGKVALEKLHSMLTLPCVVFLDLMMPVMNGWEFLAQVERDGLLPGVEIILITAAHSDKVPKNITFLPKPFSLYDVESYCKVSCKRKPDAE